MLTPGAEFKKAIEYFSRLSMLDEQDLDYYLEVYPKLERLLNNLYYYKNKYGPSTVKRCIISMINKVETKDVMSQLKTLILKISLMSTSDIKKALPTVIHLISSIESKILEEGLYDDRVKEAFGKLYDTLTGKNIDTSKLLAQLYRIYNFARASAKHTESTMSTTYIRSRPPTSPVSENVKDARRMLLEEINEEEDVNKRLLKLLLEELYKLNSNNRFPSRMEFVVYMYNNYKDEFRDLITTHNILKKAIYLKYVRIKDNGLYITQSGLKFLRKENVDEREEEG